MKLLKILAVILACTATVCSMQGCGKDGGEQVNNASESQTNNHSTFEYVADTSNKDYVKTKEDFTEKISALLDLSLYNELSESEEPGYSSYIYTIKYENEKDFPLDYTVMLGDGSTIALLKPISELEDEGWSLTSNSTPDRILNPNTLLPTAYIQNADGKKLDIEGANLSDTPLAFKDCKITGIDLGVDDISYVVCNTITNAATLEDIIKQLGAPTTIYFSIHGDGAASYITLEYVQKSNPRNNLEFKLSADGNYILNTSYGRFE